MIGKQKEPLASKLEGPSDGARSRLTSLDFTHNAVLGLVNRSLHNLLELA